MADLTPMVRQYNEIKSRNGDAILFFRLGDFYEMFNDDAELASRELGITLTGRGQNENRMPMCGIPYHAAENYIAKLLRKGHKVAICEQVEDPRLAKGIVRREITRIYTPGTLVEPSFLTEKMNNYLAVVSCEKGEFGLAYVDASTGEFRVTETSDPAVLFDELTRVSPSEILFSDMYKGELPSDHALRLTRFADRYDARAADEKLKAFFSVRSLASFGIDGLTAGLSAAAAALDYIEENQKTSLAHINKISPYAAGEYMFIDSQTRRNLELVRTIRDGSFKGSLLWVLDRCRTNMGSRMLRNWLLMPLMDINAINGRLDAVGELKEKPAARAELSGLLDNIFDIERLTAKVSSRSCSARDLVALKGSISELPKIVNIASKMSSELLSGMSGIPGLDEVKELIARAIASDPPLAVKEGGMIKDGYDRELDDLRSVKKEGKNWIAELENSERVRSGIKSLKVGFNKVFGYYIEATSSNLSQVPAEYIRKQTLANCERFITPELKEKESLVLNAEERINELEYRIFCGVRDEVARSVRDLQEAASAVARLDALLSLADVASANNYSRPMVSRSPDILISRSRHPVVEMTIGGHNFVPNDITMDEGSRFLLITGPNMAGKSTYMRQAALIMLMAQAGSFVPAQSARLPAIDRIFTRIGAMDDIFSGQSTFMLEMTETANILNNATEKSFIILDEIGRGTATFDGMSIAAAVAEHIHNRIKAKTMFATHYHEITELGKKNKGMKNLNVSVREAGDHIEFLHAIAEGPADRSYGIQVGKLAGLPKEVVERAKEVYKTLEMVENDFSATTGRKAARPRRKSGEQGEEQASLFG